MLYVFFLSVLSLSVAAIYPGAARRWSLALAVVATVTLTLAIVHGAHAAEALTHPSQIPAATTIDNQPPPHRGPLGIAIAPSTTVRDIVRAAWMVVGALTALRVLAMIWRLLRRDWKVKP